MHRGRVAYGASCQWMSWRRVSATIGDYVGDNPHMPPEMTEAKKSVHLAGDVQHLSGVVVDGKALDDAPLLVAIDGHWNEDKI